MAQDIGQAGVRARDGRAGLPARGGAKDASRDTPRDGGTRQRIMDVARAAILEKGFDATSIDEITAATGITKGGFFYHFPDKNALAIALIEEYAAEEDRMFDDLGRQAEALADDPLEALLIFLKLMAQILDDIPSGHPGCLVATFAYQERLFRADVIAANRQAVTAWRDRFGAMFRAIEATRTPRTPIPAADLADMVSTTVEGGLVLSKAFGDPTVTARQILALRGLIRAHYAG